MGEWLTGGGAILAGLIALVTAARQYRAEKARNRLEEWTGRETIIDARINAHLTRLDAEVEELRARNHELEEKVQHLTDMLNRAMEYIRKNNLPWPPEVAP